MLFSSNRMFLIVSVNLSQSIPSSGVMSFFFGNQYLHFLFVILVFDIYRFLSREFHFLFFLRLDIEVSHFRFRFFSMLSSAGIVEIGDPVSIMNSFSVSFISTDVVKYLFLSVILFISSIR